MAELDDIDTLLLKELRQNARASVATLAKKVGRSRTAVNARIARLERTGQIAGYSIKEPSDPNTEPFGAIIFVELKVRGEFEQFIQETKKIPQVASCTWIAGDFDFALLTQPTEKRDLQRVIERIFQIKGVKKTQTHLALHREF